MTASKMRMLIACLAILAGTVFGLFAGYYSARTVILNQAQVRLARYAERSAADLSGSIRESRAILGEMSASVYPYCSTAEIDYFRALVFRSQFLKDAGRLRDGHIDCSTTLGRGPAQQPRLQPNFIQRDGASLYRNPPLLSIPGQATIAVQRGDSYVLYNPFVSSLLAAPRTHYVLTDLDAPAHSSTVLSGEMPQIGDPLLTHDAQSQRSGILYATRCSAADTVCVTAYTSVPEALSLSRPTLVLLAAMGALAGALLGFVCSLLYRRNKSMHHQLLRAIRRDALRVVYQPIVELQSGRIVEAEALVRWTTDDGHAISPDVFIRVAEDGGFVGEITRLVVRRVLRDFAQTLNARPGFRVNVNIAAADLADPAFLPMLDDALRTASVRPESLGIEITESYTARQQVAKETILQLRARGHHVSIDDFGTGYSSLAYLHDLSVDAIKVDKAFTRAIGTDAVTVSILPQILAMADQLGLSVIIEGIENQPQADYFADAAQPIRAQGWLFGHPVFVETFLHLLAENDSRLQPSAIAAHGSQQFTASAC